MFPVNQNQDVKLLSELTDLKNNRVVFTKESYEVFEKCMQTKAVYNSALPYGIATAFLLQYFLPKMKFRNVAVVTGSISMFLFGKLSYGPKCYLESLVHLSNEDAKAKQQSPSTIDKDDNFDGQKEEEKHLLPFNDAPKENSTWDYYDNKFESYPNELNDTSDNLQEELINTENKKKRVTYNELWRDYKIEEAQSKLREVQKRNYNINYDTKPKLFETRKRREKMQPTTPETEFEKDNPLN